MKPARTKLRTKFLLAFALVIMITIAALSVPSYLAFRQIMLESSNRYSENLINQVRTSIFLVVTRLEGRIHAHTQGFDQTVYRLLAEDAPALERRIAVNNFLAPALFPSIGVDEIHFFAPWDLNTFVEEGLVELSDEHALTGGAFENGYAAMAVDSAGAWVNITQKQPGKIGIALPPGDTPMAGATFLNVDAGSDHPEVAVEFLKHLVSVEGQRVMFEGVGFIPTRASNQEWLREESEFADVFIRSIPLVKTYGQMNPHFFDYLNTFRPALESVYYGTAGPEEAFEKAEQEYLSIIQ